MRIKARTFQPAAKTRPGHAALEQLGAFQQSKEYTCGPATLVTLLRHFGLAGDDEPALELHIAKQLKTSASTGTHPDEMVRYLASRGFGIVARENGSVKDLADHVRRGEPVIVLWNDDGGHWSLAVGADTTRDLLILADPWDDGGPRDGQTHHALSTFGQKWFEDGFFERRREGFLIAVQSAPG